MTEDHSHENMIPPPALKAAAALVIFSLLLVVGVRVGAVSPDPTPAEIRVQQHLQPTFERQLRFADSPDGRVLVTDGRTGELVDAIGTEGSGFIRGVMRGLARERYQHQQGAAAPFRLSSWPNGALTLTDDTTGRVIELGSFGPTNRAAFARFLPIGGKTS
ncbi:photosynthetic complex assembly protein PuhC [Sphingomonas humi]|uniref:Phosphonoacetaldehyde methylase n=1 Tax=Sphingomonas humi TaxID=335630 RepID=A0ABP7RUQ3_9SPHN